MLYSYFNFYNIAINDYITFITTKSTGKRVKITEFEKTSRARKGSLVIRNVKTNPYYILNSFVLSNKMNLGLKYKEDIEMIKLTDLPIVDRNSTGTLLSKMHIIDCFQITSLEEKQSDDTYEKMGIKEQISLNIIDDKISNVNKVIKEINKNI